MTMYSLAAVVGAPILVSFISNSIRRGEIFLGPYSSHFLVVVILLGMAVVLSPYDKRPGRSAPAQELA
jgi:predicted MFS family arabinose efflux permease